MRILVTGSTGFIGRRLVSRLLDEGHAVTVLVREDATSPDERAETLDSPRDLSRIRRHERWPLGLDAIVHLAALNPERGDTAMDDAVALGQANAGGTAALARVAAETGVRRFVFASTANIHSMQGDKPIIEDDRPRPVDNYAASKLEAERRLRAELEDSATEYTIMRLPAVYGPGGKGAIAKLERLAATRLPLPFRSARNRRSILAVDNAVEAIMAMIVHPAAAGRTFLVADDAPTTLSELVAAMRGARGRSPGLFAMPVGLLRLVARLAGKSEITDRLFAEFVVDTAKIRLRTGWRPRLSTHEALTLYNRADDRGNGG
ncbi:NAD-dependent epimerase/dehydratase family protein [Aureimonas altamirensis]|uniref:NAD dependent epimerase/dehydratase family protein n=1 Tax=Aureimonas altamirensis DSM 21988 TaxID=1121026 RepID=A0ABY1INA8_9HYPH|nr:NAD-dependent epimerase/dehydratase family protein [Aureimonas altamirensis]SHJ56045.1 NAD dependent epimerase/dehydratase family protein [Aureimonas altamirensis DSM 21988]